MTTVLFDISAHGFGHLGQTLPALRGLHGRRPDLRLVLRTALPAEHVQERLGDLPCAVIGTATDEIPRMDGLFRVDIPATVDAILAYHQDWPARVAAWAEETAALSPDLLVANASYLSIAAAACNGIPAVAYGSLNWLGILDPCLPTDGVGRRVREEIRAAYAHAAECLALTPGMPFPVGVPQVRIPPVGTVGTARTAALRAVLGVPADMRLALIAFGGYDKEHLRALRVPSGWQYLGPRVMAGMPGWHHFDAAEMPFVDVMASADVVVTKPGYATFVEATAAGRPIVYIPREGWAEERMLVEWILAAGNAVASSERALFDGSIAAAMEQSLAASPKPRIDLQPGADLAVEHILAHLPG